MSARCQEEAELMARQVKRPLHNISTLGVIAGVGEIQKSSRQDKVGDGVILIGSAHQTDPLPSRGLKQPRPPLTHIYQEAELAGRDFALG